jgi:hypothetical protein
MDFLDFIIFSHVTDHEFSETPNHLSVSKNEILELSRLISQRNSSARLQSPKTKRESRWYTSGVARAQAEMMVNRFSTLATPAEFLIFGSNDDAGK